VAINAGGRLRFFVDLLFPLVLLGTFLFAPFRPFRFAVLALLVIRALSLLYAYLIPRFVKVTRSETLIHAQRFQRFRVTLDLHNRGPIPIHYLTVADTYGSFVVRGGSFMVALPPGGHRQITYEAESHYRGEFSLGPVRLRGADPMGFFSWDHQPPTPGTVLVYPAVFPVEMHEKDGLPSGSITVSSRLYEDTTRFRSVREYVAGDELKRINWKVSARMGKLFSTEYTPSIYYPVMIVLNLTEADYPMGQREHLMERAIEVGGSLLFFFVSIKQEVGIITTGSIRGSDRPPSEPARAGVGHAIGILEMLARVTAGKEPIDFTGHVLASGVPIPTGAKVMVVTPPTTDAQNDSLVALRRRGHDVQVFVVSTHQTREEDVAVPGIRSHAVRGYGSELITR
jgi:uncharacterized protein (DUF58 family)